MEQHPLNIRTNTTKRVVTIISLFGAVILLLGLLWMYTAGLFMSLNAYIEGEGYYSRYQKDSFTHLIQFVEERDPKYYWMYREAISVPLGNSVARLELEKEKPDYKIVREGLLQGMNHPENLDRIIKLFRNYRNVGFMDTAIDIWERGDELVFAIDSTASIIYEEVISKQPDSLRLAMLMSDIYVLNSKLSPLQNQFSSHLGYTARQIESLLNWIMFFTIGFLLIIAGISTRRILRNIRQSESDLLQSREQYRKIYENALEGIVQSTPEGRFISANPALVSILGYDSEQDLIRSTDSIDSQLYADEGRRDEIIKMIEKEGEVKNVESRMYRKDGSVIWIEESTLCIRDENGKALYLEGTVQDITQKKEAQIELLKRDDLLRAVADATNRLIVAEDVSDGINLALEILGVASVVDRVCIYENHEDPFSGKKATSIIYEWHNLKAGSLEEKESSQLIIIDSKPEWFSKLATGISVAAASPKEVRKKHKLLFNDDIQSQLIVPVILKDRLWGFVTFDDCSLQRSWTKSESGILQAMAGTIGNFIEKQRVEENLRNSEKQYREVVESIKEVIFQTDEFGNWVFMNSSWTEITGYSREETLGKRFFDFIHPEDRPAFEELYKSLVDSDIWYCEEEIRILVKDGSVRWLEIYARLILDNDGLVNGTTGSLYDITERKLAEEALRESNEKQRALIQASPLAIITVDEKGKVYSSNVAATSLFGWEESEMAGRALPMIHRQSKKEHTRLQEKILSGHGISSGELKGVRKDGTQVDISVSMAPIMNANNDVVAFIEIISDITEQKRSEKMIKDSLHEKEVLLKEIHHRVKNNMAIISGLLHLKADLVESEDTRILLHESSNRIRSMAMIHEMLYQNETFASIDFGSYIKSLVETIDDFYNQEQSNVSIEIDSANIYLDINDAVPCGLILNELITNAYKHAFNGKKKGWIKVSFIRKGNEFVLTVKDNGKGLPHQLNLENANSLGMNLITGLTSQLKGTLDFKNGKGATFTLRFSREGAGKGIPADR
ncbi:MAG: PAS domain S-box protein [Balneolaceae bacterium]|nr:MAG: PAS domain S-box protein [Balneolaceae bacterium]